MRIIGLAGWSGAGKTTLLAKVLPLIVARGLTVSTLKHAHHSFDLDQPGKDSHTHRAAGATEVLIASANRYALMHELRGAPEPSLYELLTKLSPVDLVVVEGFKTARYRKLEIFRAAVAKRALHVDDPLIVGIVSDTPFPTGARPVVSIDDAEAVVGLMLDHAEPIAQVLARAPVPPQQRRA
jgi:molybdopterin-guanine dinucleotide biosynthesis adapter protein